MESWYLALKVAFYVYLLLNLLWYGHLIFSDRPVLTRVRRAFAEWRAALFEQSNEEVALARHVKVLLERRRLERARIALMSYNNCAFVGGTVMFFFGVEDMPVTSLCYLGGSFMIFAFRLFRLRISLTGVRMLYSWLMLLHAVSCIPYSLWAPDKYETTGLFARFMSRLVGGLWVMDLWLCTAWNLIYSLVFCICYAMGPKGFGEAGGLTFAAEEAIMRELLVLVILLSIFRDRVMLFKTDTFRVAETQASQNEGSAKNSLLKAMCDVVVVLDEDLKIAEGCTQLQHMLRTQHNLKGDMLHHHMPSEEDRERFSQFMAAAALMEECLAEILNVRLRDRFGVDRQVELLRAKFLKLDNSVGHLVGIRVQVEEPATTSQPGQSSGHKDDMGPEDTETSFDKIMTEERLTLSFDALSGTVLDHTLPFGVLFGNLMVGSSVKEALAACPKFWSWVQQCAMQTFYGERTLPACPVDFLQMSGARFPSGLRMPIREVKIFRLPQKSFVDGSASSGAAVVVSILFLTLRTKALLRLAAAQCECCQQRLSCTSGVMEVPEDDVDEGTSACSAEWLQGNADNDLSQPSSGALSPSRSQATSRIRIKDVIKEESTQPQSSSTGSNTRIALAQATIESI